MATVNGMAAGLISEEEDNKSHFSHQDDGFFLVNNSEVKEPEVQPEEELKDPFEEQSEKKKGRLSCVPPQKTGGGI